jgi:hypothetical protein
LEKLTLRIITVLTIISELAVLRVSGPNTIFVVKQTYGYKVTMRITTILAAVAPELIILSASVSVSFVVVTLNTLLVGSN